MSSRRVVDMVLRVNGTPSLAAARASARSPWLCNMPFNPVGAMTRGALAGRPRIASPAWARGRVDQGLRDQAQTLQGFAVGAQRPLAVGPALDVLERDPRDATPGNLA